MTIYEINKVMCTEYILPVSLRCNHHHHLLAGEYLSTEYIYKLYVPLAIDIITPDNKQGRVISRTVVPLYIMRLIPR